MVYNGVMMTLSTPQNDDKYHTQDEGQAGGMVDLHTPPGPAPGPHRDAHGRLLPGHPGLKRKKPPKQPPEPPQPLPDVGMDLRSRAVARFRSDPSLWEALLDNLIKDATEGKGKAREHLLALLGIDLARPQVSVDARSVTVERVIHAHLGPDGRPVLPPGYTQGQPLDVDDDRTLDMP